MNELSELFKNVNDNETIVLERERIYDVRQDDSFLLTGYYCSNTAKKDENPDGTRFTAIYIKEKEILLLMVTGLLF